VVLPKSYDVSRGLIASIFNIVKYATQQALLAAYFILDYCLAYTSALKMEAACSTKCRLNFNGLHVLIYQ
jgi:hypothetical protein